MVEAWSPEPEEVHAEIPTRNNGEPFDDDSYPTETQVQQHIATATMMVIAEEGVGDLPDFDPDDERVVRIHDLAKVAATKKAASSIEYKHFPEQNNPLDNSGEGASLFGEYRSAVAGLARMLAKYRGRGRRQVSTLRLSSAMVYRPGVFDAEA